jgi:hypothetical protein
MRGNSSRAGDRAQRADRLEAMARELLPRGGPGERKRAIICLAIAAILVILLGFRVGAAATTFLPDAPPPG